MPEVKKYTIRIRWDLDPTKPEQIDEKYGLFDRPEDAKKALVQKGWSIDTGVCTIIELIIPVNDIEDLPINYETGE